MRLVNTADGEELFADLKVARTFREKTRGLLGRSGMAAGEALLIPRCRCVHTFFMRFDIGLIFVDEKNVVVSVREDVAPWRIAWERRAAAVIECAAESPALRRVKAGDRLQLPDK